MSRYEDPRPCGCRGDDNYCKRCDPARIKDSIGQAVKEVNEGKRRGGQRPARRDDDRPPSRTRR
jgi:hypothetical protein